ncbi:MAG: ABC-2 family transporter protein [Parcubacteria group bacterium]|nr:ABC-2 family transporter protein [Parcubacteria group bacterium]
MKKYLKIYRVFINNSISYLAQYRKDTWMNFALNFLWLGMVFVMIEVIFSQTNSIAGWDKYEVYFLTIIWIIVDELYILFFGKNIEMIPSIVTEGKLDWLLTKPANKLFLISAHKITIQALYHLILESFVLVWLVWNFDFAISIYHILLIIPLMAVGVMITYSSLLILNTLSFWFFRIDNINELFYSLNRVGRFPISFLPKTLKVVMFTVIPIAFQAYVPVATLTGRWPWYGILYAFVFTIVLFIAAVKFWNFAVKRYSSASS